ncbi:MAG: flagellar basal body rod protein FlgB [Burkholderiaceae bacterium]|nr:flagellar basal body rod protein FlgB [Burkholderiaceae bacterium]
MIEKTEAVTTQMLKLALDAASLNHEAIANNIANVNTPGYAPVRVNFDEQLAGLRETLEQGGRVKADMLAGIQPVFEREATPVDIESDRTAALDMETAKLAQNTVHYEALLKVAGMRMSMVNSAINEGKR